jgi:hypothetical protein
MIPDNLWVTKRIVGEREIGNLVSYYEDGDDDGNGYCDSLREKQVGRGGGEEEWKDGFVFIHCFHF